MLMLLVIQKLWCYVQAPLNYVLYVRAAGSYCCIAKNCMGQATSSAELTVEDIQNQLNEEERLQLFSTNQPPKFIVGLKSCEAKITEEFRFTVQGG
jgi:hypothetical protein